jgi:predicted HAD superfamily phosphohydrolase
VVSAAPEDVVFAALDGIVARDHIVATRLAYDPASGEIASVVRVAAGYGKVAAVEELRVARRVPRDRVVYVGDGSSDLHVMLHVNRGEGITIAASEARHIAEVAKRTVISDDALSVLVPVLEEIGGYPSSRIRSLFEEQGFLIQEWDKVRTDRVTIRENVEPPV